MHRMSFLSHCASPKNSHRGLSYTCGDWSWKSTVKQATDAEISTSIRDKQIFNPLFSEATTSIPSEAAEEAARGMGD